MLNVKMSLKGLGYLILILLILNSAVKSMQQRATRSIDLSSSHILIQDSRLSYVVRPLNYNLTLYTDLAENRYDGSIGIYVAIKKDTKRIYLHAHSELNVNESCISVECKKPLISTTVNNEYNISVTRVDRTPKKSTLTLFLNGTIEEGSNCEIILHFDGNIWDNTDGLFHGSYVDATNNFTERFLATNMKPNNARRVFPCFDEPEFKATFSVAISRPKDFVTFFNSPVNRSVNLINGDVLEYFEETQPMSTSFFGFVIARLEKVKKINDCFRTTPEINVWTTPESNNEIEYLVCKLVKLFNYTETYFNALLPLSKIDILAIAEFPLVRPVDNWGLIIYRESELLKNSTSALSSELITQWLGAWLTPEWWNDMPIIKALSSFLAAQSALEFDDGSEYGGKYPMTILYSVYYEFSKRYPNSRITGMKHESSSYKTELVLRMLNYTLNSSTFKIGLQNFIRDFQNRTFIGSDIWNELTTQAIEDGTLNENYNISEIIGSWFEMDRLPAIKITRDYEKKSAKIVQKLYLRERPHDVPDREKMLWWIPIILIKQNDFNFLNMTPYVWMKKEREIEIYEMPNKEEFIIVNPEEIGPFPVNYDERNWYLLSKFLETESGRNQIPTFTRAKLLHDAWNLAYAGDLDFGTAFNMTLFLKHERNHVVWNPVFTFIDHVGRHIDMSDVHNQFETYVKYLLSPLYEELGPFVNAEDKWKTNLRSLAKTFLCRCGYRPCIEAAQKEYEIWMSNVMAEKEISIPKDVMCPIFKWGTFEEWNFGMQRVINYPKTGVKSERTFLLKMLAKCPIQTTTITHLLNITFFEGSTNFPDTDIILILRALTERSNGYQGLFDFLSENWTSLRERLSGKSNVWDTLISSATGHFTTQIGYDKVKKLYEEKSGEFGSADHIIVRCLKNIKEEIKWTNENIPAIEKWLNRFLASVKIDKEKL